MQILLAFNLVLDEVLISYTPARLITLTYNLAYWIFAFSYWNLSVRVALKIQSKDENLYDQEMQRYFCFFTVLNCFFPCCYIIFGSLQQLYGHNKTIKIFEGICFYGSGALLFITCLILFRAIYKIT